ncbi:MAG: GspE/PulE family protein [Phycisphaerales bacterium]
MISKQPERSSGGMEVGERVRLGELLVMRGIISPDQLDQVLERQRERGFTRLLGEVVVDMDFATDDDILRVLAEAHGVPYLSNAARVADARVVELLPREFLEEHRVLPLFLVRGTLTVAVAEPANLFLTDEIERITGHRVQIAVARADEIASAIKAYLPNANVFVIDEIYEDINDEDFSLIERQVQELTDLEEIAGQSPVVKLVNYIIFTAVQEGASDVHIEPDDRTLRIRFRLDGKLFERNRPPYQMQAAIVSRIKIMSNLDISERRVPQDGDIHVMIEGRPIDLRVSTMPGKFGEKVVIRIIDNRNAIVALEKLGFSPMMLNGWKNVVSNPNGVVLVTGPTGSGKSTTLYSVLSEIADESLNVSTVEDPVEAHLPGINQSQVNDKAGFSFAKALRALLRQDPDIIMVGEVRDEETAVIATQAALTGHLVFSTLHTNDALSAVTRLIHIGIEPFLVAATLRGVLAQRLVRKICPHCREEYDPDELTRSLIEELAGPFELLARGAGCTRCRGTGFAGRIGIFELLDPEDELLSAIAQGANLHELGTMLAQNGFVTLRTDGMQKARSGLTTAEEVFNVTVT